MHWRFYRSYNQTNRYNGAGWKNTSSYAILMGVVHSIKAYSSELKSNQFSNSDFSPGPASLPYNTENNNVIQVNKEPVSSAG